MRRDEMKVAFLIHSLQVSGCRYRVLQYLPYLEKHGVGVSIHFFQRNWRDKWRFYDSLGQYDIFYVHRKLFPFLELAYLRRKAKKIVYDFDDAVMYRSSGSKSPHSLSRRVRFGYMMKRVDFVIAGNQFLRSEVLPYNSNVEIVPTSVDLSQYTEKEPSGPKDRTTVGWLGSGSTLKYLKGLLPVLENLYQKYPHFQLKIVCDEFPERVNLPMIKKPWSAEEEEADLRSFDIGIMPLTDDPWSRGKCGLKILQYYTVGIPVVCAPVGVNRDIVQDGVNGFWAENERQWEEKILKLIQEETLRKEMGFKGRKKVEGAYCIEVNAPKLLAILRQVHSEGRAH